MNYELPGAVRLRPSHWPHGSRRREGDVSLVHVDEMPLCARSSACWAHRSNPRSSLATLLIRTLDRSRSGSAAASRTVAFGEPPGGAQGTSRPHSPDSRLAQGLEHRQRRRPLGEPARGALSPVANQATVGGRTPARATIELTVGRTIRCRTRKASAALLARLALMVGSMVAASALASPAVVQAGAGATGCARQQDPCQPLSRLGLGHDLLRHHGPGGRAGLSTAFHVRGAAHWSRSTGSLAFRRGRCL